MSLLALRWQRLGRHPAELAPVEWFGQKLVANDGISVLKRSATRMFQELFQPATEPIM